MGLQQDDRAYRRGVVFGFTVAEVVLLLVFCLLLLFMPLLLRELPAQKQATSTATHVEVKASMPLPSSSDAQGPAGRKRDAVPSGQSKGGEPAIGDPSTSGGDQSAAKPLPQGWIQVAPNVSSASETPSAALQQRRSSSNSAASPDGTRAADALPASNANALTLEAACERLRIPSNECTVSRADNELMNAGKHNWPPIIKLKEADGEFFLVGRAEVSKAFEEKIRRDVVPRILDLVRKYQTDVVEVVGHTDEQPIQGLNTNLDTAVFDVIARGEPPSRLRMADNAGLGFARAVAIVQILKSERRLDGLTILPLSAAQVVEVDGRLSDGSKAGDVRERRRIEIRVRQSSVGKENEGK